MDADLRFLASAHSQLTRDNLNLGVLTLDSLRRRTGYSPRQAHNTGDKSLQDGPHGGSILRHENIAMLGAQMLWRCTRTRAVCKKKRR